MKINLGTQATTPAMRIFRFLLSLIALAVILTAAFFLFIYVVIFAVVLLAYWWWKTRALRKQLRSAFQQQSFRQQSSFGDENVVEGEVVRESGGKSALLQGDVIYPKSANDKSY
jgi:ABC-type bacteriocin/lantibiotic exporter with double-glycine peptidase domain